MSRRTKQKSKLDLSLVLAVGLLGVGVITAAWLLFVPSQKVLGDRITNGGYRYVAGYGYGYFDGNGSPIVSASIIKVFSIQPERTTVKRGGSVRLTTIAFDNNRRPVERYYVVWPAQPFGGPIAYSAKEATYRVKTAIRPGRYYVKPTVYYISGGTVRKISATAEVIVR